MIDGIDLGTTNSLCTIFQGQKAHPIPNALSELLSPSVVGLDDNEKVLVGSAAREQLLTHPDRTAANFKRYMGTKRTL